MSQYLNRGSLVATAAVAAVASCAVCLWASPSRPKEYKDRLRGPQKDLGEDVTMDMDMYEDEQSWGDDEHPLALVNTARVPYFDEVWMSQSVNAQSTPRSAFLMLDVGCGGGIATEALASLGWSMVGLDPAVGAIQAARSHAKRRGIQNVEYTAGSASTLPFENEHFDGVVSSDVLEHLEDVPTCLQEIFRVLKPGGVFTFDTINRTVFSWYYTVLIPQHLLRIMPQHAHDWRMYITPKELRTALKAAGFEVSADDDSPEWRGMGPTIRWPHQALWRTFKKRSLIGAIGPWKQVSPSSVQGLNASYLGWARKPL